MKKKKKKSSKKPSRSLVTDTGMRAKTYAMLRTAVEDGITVGYNRAHKHTPTPDREDVKGQIELAVMSEICEYFTFDDEGT